MIKENQPYVTSTYAPEWFRRPLEDKNYFKPWTGIFPYEAQNEKVDESGRWLDDGGRA